MGKKSAALLLVLIAVLALICTPTGVALATEEDETSGLQADTLTINVGYYGTRYYQKKVFTVDELIALGLEEAVYSYIDRMPAVCLNYARGVPLSTIMEAAGIDINSIQSFHFYTNDNKGGKFTSWTKKELLDTTRYYYPNLVFRYYEPDFEKDRMDKQAAAGAIPVPAMIAVSDSWKRHLPGPDDFGEIDYSDSAQRTQTRFRLLFGQTDTYTSTANRSAKWVHSIEVMLGGAPAITTDISVLEKEVGSKYRFMATVTAADDLLAEQIKKNLVWSTSDPSVATVDSKGNVTITGEGEVVITVSCYKEDNPGELLTAATVRITGVSPESSEPDDGKKKPEQPGDKDEIFVGTISPSGGTGSGLPIAFLKKKKAGSHKPLKKKAILNPGEKPDLVVSTSTVFTLRFKNVNQAKGLFSGHADGEENKGDEGALQNWRKTEMANTAVPLGRIDDQVSICSVLIAALSLLLISIIGRVAEFYLAI